MCVAAQVIFSFFFSFRKKKVVINETVSFAIREKRHFNVEFGGYTTIVDHQTSYV